MFYDPIYCLSQVDATTSITATDLLAKLESYAAGFQLNGVKQGDRVCCHFANSIESFSALFGVIFAGGVAVLADDELTQRRSASYFIVLLIVIVQIKLFIPCPVITIKR
ncbi:hypothetical protein HPB48_001596 [Haemaphysalis longicornis]|uniref:AMP-dependent synthetase/ligase domain-containing protein n=1 Tax=Haemaphysalis longicornis TaxID=44386 RepID=A0A9J6GAY3_HAELO|nr:hypothetical protein HPB48_001596 [Haemaphysalis longicornis]